MCTELPLVAQTLRGPYGGEAGKKWQTGARMPQTLQLDPRSLHSCQGSLTVRAQVPELQLADSFVFSSRVNDRERDGDREIRNR